ncbi:GerAB/ArcD/ProY family transporter [Alkalihalobacterium bogoriense]|uniref:GerAB/ArcD/ProY family transporter n=1 Tax=Alkalihalobacterium bogoriense TaxID=246272 RepID=UPI00047AE7B2|nr:GerAB/ArcD/ProY family transporter [Alkalihalobacterium bogoriense]
MDLGKIKKLNKYHVVFLTQNVLIGIGLFSLPHDISSLGYNLWILPLIYGVIATLTLIPILALCKRYPDSSLYSINEKLLGKYVGKGLNVLIIFFAIIHTSSVCHSYVRVLQTVSYPDNTILISSLSLYFVLVLIVLGGIKSVARFCIFSFFITGWMLYFVKWAFQQGELMHAVPTLEHDLSIWLSSMHSGAGVMFGYVLVLFYFPYIQNQKKTFRHMTIGIWIAVTYYVVVCLASVVYFSTWQQANLVLPILNLFQSVQLPLVERIENFGVSIWVFLVLSTSSAYLWVAKKGVDALFSNYKDKAWHVYPVAFISIMLFLGPLSVELQEVIFGDINVYSEYAVIVLPVFLLCVHWLKSKLKKEGNHENTHEA